MSTQNEKIPKKKKSYVTMRVHRLTFIFISVIGTSHWTMGPTSSNTVSYHPMKQIHHGMWAPKTSPKDFHARTTFVL